MMIHFKITQFRVLYTYIYGCFTLIGYLRTFVKLLKYLQGPCTEIVTKLDLLNRESNKYSYNVCLG